MEHTCQLKEKCDGTRYELIDNMTLCEYADEYRKRLILKTIDFTNFKER